MEKMLETPLETTVNQMETTTTLASKSHHYLHNQTIKSPISQNSASDVCKAVTPNRLKVPKAFKYPERYTSPTDLMMSPISRGLLARSRKPRADLLPPSKNQADLQSLQPQEAGLSGILNFGAAV